MKTLLHRFSDSFIHRQVPIAPLVIFRIIWGLLMFVSVVRFAANGWIASLYIDPSFYFSFIPGIAPLPGMGMYVVFAGMGLASIGVALGYYYRFSAGSFFILFTYVELLDKTNYLNHYYFVSLVSFLLMFLPSHRSFSYDVRFRGTKEVSNVSVGFLYLLRVQLGIVYVFAGLAKINTDWLIRAQPLKIWLASKVHIPLIGGAFRYSATAYVFSWFGMLYDITVPFFLCIRKALPYAYAAVVIFHLMTWLLFPIGMFPFIMIAATTLFFPVEVHERVLKWLRRMTKQNPQIPQSEWSISTGAKVFFGIFVLVQLALPLRFFLHNGDLYWNESGYRFSWRVMLMEKSGAITFYVSDGERRVAVNNLDYLTPQQEKMMATQPDMIAQFADFLKQEYEKKDFQNPKVYADSWVSLNGRPSRTFADPKIDLTSEIVKTPRSNWIVQHD